MTISDTRDQFGFWSRDTGPCFLCHGTGAVTPDIADEYHHHIDQERP